MIFEDEEFRDGLRQEFLRHGLAVVCQGEFDVEGQPVRPALQPAKDRLGLMVLIVLQPGDGGANTGFGLQLK